MPRSKMRKTPVLPDDGQPAGRRSPSRSSKGATSWDGGHTENGWVEIPVDEVAVPPGYRALRSYITATRVRIHVEPKIHLRFCPACGAAIAPRGFYEPEYLDSPQCGRSTTIIIHQQRYQCQGKDARHYRTDLLPGIDDKRHMMARARIALRRDIDRSDLANSKSFGISDKTVAATHRDDAESITKRQQTTGKYTNLIVDEKIFHGSAHFQMTDGVTHAMLEILPSDRADEIERVLKNYAHLDVVEYIAMDFTGHYAAIFERLCPNARIIRDPWHLLNRLHECRENARKDASQRATPEGKSALRGRRDFWQEVNRPGWLGQQACLFDDGPLIADANQAYLDFLNGWRSASNSTEAAQYFGHWVSCLPDSIRKFFQSFINLIDEHFDEVFLYHDTGITSGPGEASNRNVQDTLDRFRRLSHAGLEVRVKVREDVKRRRALGSADDPSELDPSREADLAISNSIARSERMVKICAEAKQKRLATEAGRSEDKAATAQESVADSPSLSQRST